MTSSALLVMDLQQDIVGRFNGDDGYLPRMRQAVQGARAAGIPVIYVVVGFRAGHPEISSRNKLFGAIAAGAGARFTDADPGAAIHPDVAPLPGDIVVTKRRVSAFAGSDLDMVLRASGIGTLVLSGIATSGVVLSTIRQAADLDYGLVVLKDGCLDSDPEVHRVLTEKVFPNQADVLSIDEWLSGAGAAGQSAH